MMIGPKAYSAVVLAGMTKEEAIEEIKTLKNSIKELETALRSGEETGEEFYPKPQTRLSAFKEYLAEAKRYFKEMGWEEEFPEE